MNSDFSFLVFLILVVVVVALISVPNVRRVKKQDLRELREAEAVYRSSLAALKVSPVDPDLKEDALRKGRIYSNLTRRRQGVTMYDEVALMNDISAACAGASQAIRDGAAKSLEDRLSYMKQLKERNLITEQEYERRRGEIIKEL